MYDLNKSVLYTIAWLGEDLEDFLNSNPKFFNKTSLDKSIDTLLKNDLIKKENNYYLVTSKGFDSLSTLAQAATRRPKNYMELSFRNQWSIDSSLGILDWDGL